MSRSDDCFMFREPDLQIENCQGSYIGKIYKTCNLFPEECKIFYLISCNFTIHKYMDISGAEFRITSYT